MGESEVVNEWRREGAVEALQRTLRRFLEQRFGTLPQATINRIEAASDINRLDQALDQVDHLRSLDDLSL
jgi:hypothetical protein